MELDSQTGVRLMSQKESKELAVMRTKDTTAMLGLPRRIVHLYGQLGIAPPSLPSQGRGHSAGFTYQDVLKMLIASRLEALGIAQRHLARIVSRIMDELGQPSEESSAQMAVVTLGQNGGVDISLFRSDEKLMRVLAGQGLESGQVCSIVIDLRRAAEELRTKMAERFGVGKD